MNINTGMVMMQLSGYWGTCRQSVGVSVGYPMGYP